MLGFSCPFCQVCNRGEKIQDVRGALQSGSLSLWERCMVKSVGCGKNIPLLCLVSPSVVIGPDASPACLPIAMQQRGPHTLGSGLGHPMAECHTQIERVAHLHLTWVQVGQDA